VPSGIDLNRPIENLALVQAIAGVAADPSDSTKDNLLVELNRANFLAAMLADELKMNEVEPGHVQIDAGSKFGVLSASSGGKNFLLLFTDWHKGASWAAPRRGSQPIRAISLLALSTLRREAPKRKTAPSSASGSYLLYWEQAAVTPKKSLERSREGKSAKFIQQRARRSDRPLAISSTLGESYGCVGNWNIRRRHSDGFSQ
jgi:hypothetical protein